MTAILAVKDKDWVRLASDSMGSCELDKDYKMNKFIQNDFWWIAFSWTMLWMKYLEKFTNYNEDFYISCTNIYEYLIQLKDSIWAMSIIYTDWNTIMNISTGYWLTEACPNWLIQSAWSWWNASYVVCRYLLEQWHAPMDSATKWIDYAIKISEWCWWEVQTLFIPKKI